MKRIIFLLSSVAALVLGGGAYFRV